MSCTIFIHNDRKHPKFVIPLIDPYFLSWTAPDGGDISVQKTSWVLRHRDKDLPSVVAGMTVQDIFEGSPHLREATSLEVLLYTDQPSNMIEDTVERYRSLISGSEEPLIEVDLSSEKLKEN